MVSVVVPFLNEEENLPDLHARLTRALDGQPEGLEIIFVDDGSTDSSARWVADKATDDPRVKLLRLSRNFGHQIAITAGLDYAEGDAVVIMDADLQDPPEVVPELLAKWREGYDVVYAQRKARQGETWLKKALASLFYRIFRSLTSLEVPRDAGDFRLLDRKPVEALRQVRELHRFVRGLTSWVGFRHTAVFYERAARHAGRTKYPIWKSLALAFDAITSFSGAPLRWVMGIGIAVSILGVFAVIRIVLARLLYPDTLQPGWASLTAIVLLLGGMQLFCMGLLGQYVSRIFEETKKRPLYLVREKVGAFAVSEEAARAWPRSRPQA
jgi:polyisoprenyl-phosphate glycosyltransferase